MVANSVEKLVGIGLYTPREAARFARVSTPLVTRWLFGNRAGASVVDAELREHEERFVTFQDFVQVLAIRAIRSEFNISLQKIRGAVEHARNHYGVEYPFAVPHQTYLFGEEIVIRLKDDLYQISGRGKDQQMIREVAQLYMEDLHFDGKRPVKYDIFEHGGETVTMAPEVSLGQPRLACGYTADALLQAFQTEGSIDLAAKVMGVSTDDIKLALRFDDFLQTPASVSRAA